MKQVQLFQSISQLKNTLLLYKNIARWKPNKMELFKKHYWNLLYRIITDISPENYALRREKEKEFTFCGLNTGFEETDAHQYDSYYNSLSDRWLSLEMDNNKQKWHQELCNKLRAFQW